MTFRNPTPFALAAAILLFFLPLYGQPTLVGSGYTSPVLIRVSPGQIVTFFVTGIAIDTSVPSQAIASPLPASLAGLSVTINQSSPKQSLTAPLLGVQQLNVCNGGASATPSTPPDCIAIAVTIQMPYEIAPLSPARSGATADAGQTEVVITANGRPGKSFSIQPVIDNLHILNTCDSFPSLKVGGTASALNFGCNSVVTHPDGSLVTATSPAKSDEEVVIYAYGLGQTFPAAKTGAVSPSPGPAVPADVIGLQFDFHPNAGPSAPYTGPGGIPVSVDPLFAGLTSGQIGLYQINVKLPAFPESLSPCSTFGGGNLGGATLLNVIDSNLSINIRGYSSYDSARICAQPNQ